MPKFTLGTEFEVFAEHEEEARKWFIQDMNNIGIHEDEYDILYIQDTSEDLDGE